MFVPEPDAVLHAGDIVMASVKEEAFGKIERYMEE
jgi:Trk K+ transport system NAD-binding subunit